MELHVQLQKTQVQAHLWISNTIELLGINRFAMFVEIEIHPH